MLFFSPLHKCQSSCSWLRKTAYTEILIHLELHYVNDTFEFLLLMFGWFGPLTNGGNSHQKASLGFGMYCLPDIFSYGWLLGTLFLKSISYHWNLVETKEVIWLSSLMFPFCGGSCWAQWVTWWIVSNRSHRSNGKWYIQEQPDWLQ